MNFKGYGLQVTMRPYVVDGQAKKSYTLELHEPIVKGEDGISIVNRKFIKIAKLDSDNVEAAHEEAEKIAYEFFSTWLNRVEMKTWCNR